MLQVSARSWLPLSYVIVRTTFAVFYWLRANHLRSLSWPAGMICILVLGVETGLATIAG
jgi:uncharacterized MAPEG superfamily protein